MTQHQTDTLELLRTHGVKVTRQRVAVFNILRELGHASADMICHRCEGVTVATIYNVLECLVKSGLIQRRYTANNKMFFDITTQPHCHIYDEETNSYQDFKDEHLMELVQKEIMKDVKDFDVSGIEIQIVGHKHHDDN